MERNRALREKEKLKIRVALQRDCRSVSTHTVTQVASAVFYYPGEWACCVFMAVSSDVSLPSVTQSSGFSLFVPLNCLLCGDVT